MRLPKSGSAAGMTLVELLVVVVMGSFVAIASLSVLITTQRTFTANGATIEGQQSTRIAAQVMFAEMRQASARGGDIVAIASDSLRLGMMRKFAYACEVDIGGTDPVVTVLDTLFGRASGHVDKVPTMFGANAFAVGDTAMVFADNDTGVDGDDVWLALEITGVDGTATCPQNSEGGTAVTFGGQMAAFLADDVYQGAPLRSRLYYTFGDTVIGSDTYLARREGNGAMVPLAGPIQATTGLEFVYLDSLGAVTATLADIRQIEVTLRTGSEVINSLGQLVSDSITTRIYTRN